MSKNKQTFMHHNDRTQIVKEWHVRSVIKAMSLVEINQAKKQAQKKPKETLAVSSHDSNLLSYMEMNNAKYARIISQEK